VRREETANDAQNFLPAERATGAAAITCRSWLKFFCLLLRRRRGDALAALVAALYSPLQAYV